MFASLARFSRTTYRGARGSGPGRSGKTDARSSPHSRPTAAESAHAGFTFKQAQRGLYDGRIIQFGNNVPKSRQKTRRTWLPNVQRQHVFSELLDRDIRMKVTTSALRSIAKAGGLDRYLAKTKDSLLGEYGRQLRDSIALRLRRGTLPGLSKVLERQQLEAAAEASAVALSKPARAPSSRPVASASTSPSSSSAAATTAAPSR